MNIAERNDKLKYFIICLKCEISGKCCDDNCPTQYAAGNMGEVVENLEAISKSIEQEPCDDAISRQAVLDLPRIKTHNEWGNVIKESVDVEDVRRLPPVTSQPKTGYISIDDVMSVFDDFMCGEVDEEGTDEFLIMLKDRADRSET